MEQAGSRLGDHAGDRGSLMGMESELGGQAGQCECISGLVVVAGYQGVEAFVVVGQEPSGALGIGEYPGGEVVVETVGVAFGDLGGFWVDDDSPVVVECVDHDRFGVEHVLEDAASRVVAAAVDLGGGSALVCATYLPTVDGVVCDGCVGGELLGEELGVVLCGNPGGADGGYDVGDTELGGQDLDQCVDVGLVGGVGVGCGARVSQLLSDVAGQVLLTRDKASVGGVEDELAQRGAGVLGATGSEEVGAVVQVDSAFLGTADGDGIGRVIGSLGLVGGVELTGGEDVGWRRFGAAVVVGLDGLGQGGIGIG